MPALLQGRARPAPPHTHPRPQRLVLRCLANLHAAPSSPSLPPAGPLARCPRFLRGTSQAALWRDCPPSVTGADWCCVEVGGHNSHGAGRAPCPGSPHLRPAMVRASHPHGLNPRTAVGGEATAGAAPLAAREQPCCTAPRPPMGAGAHSDSFWPPPLRPMASLLLLPPSRAGVALIDAARIQVLQACGGASAQSGIRTIPTSAQRVSAAPVQPSPLPRTHDPTTRHSLCVQLWRLLSCHPGWYRRALIEAMAEAGRTGPADSAAAEGWRASGRDVWVEASSMVGLVAWVLAPEHAVGEADAAVLGEGEIVPGTFSSAQVSGAAPGPAAAAFSTDATNTLGWDPPGLGQARSGQPRGGTAAAPLGEDACPRRRQVWSVVQQAAQAASVAVTDEQVTAAVDLLLLSAHGRASLARPPPGAAATSTENPARPTPALASSSASHAHGSRDIAHHPVATPPQCPVGGGRCAGAKGRCGLDGGTGVVIPAGQDRSFVSERGLALQAAIAAAAVAAEPRTWLHIVWGRLLGHAEGETGGAACAAAACPNSCNGGAQAEPWAQAACAEGTRRDPKCEPDGQRRTAHVSSLFTAWLSSLVDACCEDAEGSSQPQSKTGPLPPAPETKSRHSAQRAARRLRLASAVAHTAAEVAQMADASPHADDARRATAALLARVEAAMADWLPGAAPDSVLGGSDALEDEVDGARRLLAKALQKAWTVLSHMST